MFYPNLILISYSSFFLFLFMSCALLSIGLGSIGALYQIKIKRLLAYSTIANLGYILLGFCTISFFGFFASLYYFFIYILTLIQMFLILVNIRYFT